MKTGLLRKLTVAGIAMLMLVTLASGIGQASGNFYTITYNSNYRGGPAEVTVTVREGNLYYITPPPPLPVTAIH